MITNNMSPFTNPHSFKKVLFIPSSSSISLSEKKDILSDQKNIIAVGYHQNLSPNNGKPAVAASFC
jgi:hypothetical protein